MACGPSRRSQGRRRAKNALSRPLGRCDAPGCAARLFRGCQDGANPCQSPRLRSSGWAGQRADGRHEPPEPEPGRPDSWGQLRERFAASGCPEIELRLDGRLSPVSAGPEDGAKRRWWPRDASRCRSSGASTAIAARPESTADFVLVAAGRATGIGERRPPPKVVAPLCMTRHVGALAAKAALSRRTTRSRGCARAESASHGDREPMTGIVTRTGMRLPRPDMSAIVADGRAADLARPAQSLEPVRATW